MDVLKTTTVSSHYHPTSSLSQPYIRFPAWHGAYTSRLLVRVPTNVDGINHHSIYGSTYIIAESRDIVVVRMASPKSVCGKRASRDGSLFNALSDIIPASSVLVV